MLLYLKFGIIIIRKLIVCESLHFWIATIKDELDKRFKGIIIAWKETISHYT